jgi:hypothetical protein
MRFIKLSSPDQGQQARGSGEIIPHKHDAEYLRNFFVRKCCCSLGASLVRMRMRVNWGRNGGAKGRANPLVGQIHGHRMSVIESCWNTGSVICRRVVAV